jgi:hypothetical protein
MICIDILGSEKIVKHIDNFFFSRRHVVTIKSRQSQKNSKIKQRIANVFTVRRTHLIK